MAGDNSHSKGFIREQSEEREHINISYLLRQIHEDRKGLLATESRAGVQGPDASKGLGQLALSGMPDPHSPSALPRGSDGNLELGAALEREML